VRAFVDKRRSFARSGSLTTDLGSESVRSDNAGHSHPARDRPQIFPMNEVMNTTEYADAQLLWKMFYFFDQLQWESVFDQKLRLSLALSVWKIVPVLCLNHIPVQFRQILQPIVMVHVTDDGLGRL